MRRITVFLIILVLCFLLAIWSPWIYWDFDFRKLFGVNEPDAIAGLQVTSLAGNINVLIDGEDNGTAEFGKEPLIVDRVEPGERLISLARKSDSDNNFWEYRKLITFEKGTTVILSYNLGPKEFFSEGHLIYAVKKIDKTAQTKLNTRINVEGASILLDSVSPETISGNETSSVLNLSSQHKITISKINYEPLTFTILPEALEEREKLKDFDINMEVQLMLQPLDVL